MRFKLFYGWYIVIASLLVAAYFSAIFTYGWTAFIDPIRLSLGWSMTTISLASTLRGAEAGIFNPMWGRAVDRLNPARLMMFGVICTGVGILIISFSKNSLVNPIVTYYVGFMIMGLASSLATSMIPSAIIARWFRRDLGKANGIFYMGVGIGGVMIPLVVKLVDAYGWQHTLMYSALGYIVMGVPLSFVLRRRPEDYGLVPDGRVEAQNNPKRKAAANYDFNVPVKKAVRTRAFWYFNVVILYQSAVLGVISLFAIPYLTNLGMSRSAAGFVVLLFTIISLVGRFGLGILSDIFSKKYVLALSTALLGVGLLLFWMMSAETPYWLTILFALTYGTGIAGIMPLRMPLMVEHFGTRNIGALFGLISIASTVSLVGAAPLAARVFDVYHTYKPSLLFLIGFSVIAVILMAILPSPGKRAEATTAADNRASLST
jgi:sugar phosphate permease